MPKSNETNFWLRLCEAMQEAEITPNQTNAGKLLKKKQTTAKKWQDGGLPNMKNTVRLAEKLGVNTEWLLTGRGQKRPDTAYPTTITAVISLMKQLTPQQQNQVLALAKVVQQQAAENGENL